MQSLALAYAVTPGKGQEWRYLGMEESEARGRTLQELSRLETMDP